MNPEEDKRERTEVEAQTPPKGLFLRRLIFTTVLVLVVVASPNVMAGSCFFLLMIACYLVDGAAYPSNRTLVYLAMLFIASIVGPRFVQG